MADGAARFSRAGQIGTRVGTQFIASILGLIGRDESRPYCDGQGYGNSASGGAGTMTWIVQGWRSMRS